jgi:hypothetical protein
VEKPACEHDVNLYSTFAPFSQRGLPSGAVETSCDRCGETTISGQIGRDSLLDAAVWARDHKCPPPVARIRVPELDRPGRAGAESAAAGQRPPADPVPRAADRPISSRDTILRPPKISALPLPSC